MTQTIPTSGEVRNNPELFAKTFLRILDKNKRLIPLTYNDAQLHYLKNRTRRDLVLKARQLGFSTLIQAEFWRIVTTRTASTQTLGNDDENTQKLRRLFQRFYDKLPEVAPKPARKLDNASISTFPGYDSEALIATAGNRNAGRGGTYTHIHGSEVAFWNDAESLIASAVQGGNPAVVLESTPNGAQGYFYRLCMEALDGSNDWRLHFYAWWWDRNYRTPLEDGETLVYTDEEKELVRLHKLSPEQIKWRRSKVRELKHLFAQEYAESPLSCFLHSGVGYMGDIGHVYTAPMDATPQEGHEYVAGLDFGQQADFTVCSVIDKTTMQQVALLRIRQMAWAEMRRQVRQLCRAWDVRVLKPETNSMGSTNIEALRDEFRTDGLSTAIVPFTTTNATKTAIMAALRESLHSSVRGVRLLPLPEQKHEMSGLQAKQTITGVWQIAAPDGEHDDIAIANALALDAIIGGGVLTIDDAPNLLTDWRG